MKAGSLVMERHDRQTAQRRQSSVAGNLATAHLGAEQRGDLAKQSIDVVVVRVDLVEAGGGVRAYQRKGRVGNGDGVRRWPSPAGSTRPSAWRWGDSELRAAAGLRDEG